MTYKKEREVATRAVIEACNLCQSVQQSLVTEDSIEKKDKSPVTIADFGSQAIVNYQIHQYFPEDPIVGEEDASELRKPEQLMIKTKMVEQVQKIVSNLDETDVLEAIDLGNYQGGATGRHWTLDPIDGTKGFLRGEQYAVALALIEDGEVVFGVLGCPNLPLSLNDESQKGCLFIAAKGEGTYMHNLNTGKEFRIEVSSIFNPSDARFCESVESGHSKHDDSARIAEILKIKTDPVRIDSQCKYAVVARGDASIYLRLPTRADYEEKIWDHAAGCIVVTEAGGKVTDIHGDKLDFSIGTNLKNNKGVVATNGAFHGEVIQAVQSVVGK